jgi:hypothetical protein
VCCCVVISIRFIVLCRYYCIVYVLLYCVGIIVLFTFYCIVLLGIIVECCFIVFVCTRVGLLPPGAKTIAVNNINNNIAYIDISTSSINLTSMANAFIEDTKLHIQ